MSVASHNALNQSTNTAQSRLMNQAYPFRSEHQHSFSAFQQKTSDGTPDETSRTTYMHDSQAIIYVGSQTAFRTLTARRTESCVAAAPHRK